jgi:hypothetical protein
MLTRMNLSHMLLNLNLRAPSGISPLLMHQHWMRWALGRCLKPTHFVNICYKRARRLLTHRMRTKFSGFRTMPCFIAASLRPFKTKFALFS